jgi:Uma2 family endonuclease
MALADIVTQAEKPVRLRMSYEEYLAWCDEDIRAEWVDGEVIVHMPVKAIHQIVLGFLSQLLNLYIELYDLGQLLVAPLEMKSDLEASSREPDILFIAKENLARLTEERLEGPADLIVEIISKESVRRDRDDKFKEYRAAGVREYWLIDPRRRKERADFYWLNESGEYQLLGTEDDERVESRVLPGFWLKPAWLWQAQSLSATMAFYAVRGLTAEQITIIQGLLRGDEPGGGKQ